MATHSSTLAWKIPWMEEPGRLQSRGRKESDTMERLSFPFLLPIKSNLNQIKPLDIIINILRREYTEEHCL